MSNTFTIYKLTCNINGKSYIGQTNNLSRRLSLHHTPSSKCAAIRNAIRKHGWDNFSLEVIEENLALDQANEMETFLIKEQNTLSPAGYNLSSGGSNGTKSEETKRRISEGVRKAKREHPPIFSETHRKKLSASKQGNLNPNFGKPGTMLGRKQSPESIEKRKATWKANKQKRLAEC